MQITPAAARKLCHICASSQRTETRFFVRHKNEVKRNRRKHKFWTGVLLTVQAASFSQIASQPSWPTVVNFKPPTNTRTTRKFRLGRHGNVVKIQQWTVGKLQKEKQCHCGTSWKQDKTKTLNLATLSRKSYETKMCGANQQWNVPKAQWNHWNFFDKIWEHENNRSALFQENQY